MCINSVKVCFKCERELPLSEFYKHPQMADGHLGKCKKCARADVVANYAKRREQYSKYEARRYRDPSRRKAQREYAERYKKRHPDKVKARSKFRYHLRKGNVKQKPCEVCGDENSQAHHDDYLIENALKVRWLCFTHHREAHGQIVVTDNPRYALEGIGKQMATEE
jgi:hypothetical protein